MKRACFFGIYDPEYARTRVLRRAFEENNIEVIECRVDPRIKSGLKKYSTLFFEAQKLKKKCDLVVVNFPGQSVVWIARLVFRVPIIFDAFLSLYDSNVFDRKIYSRLHPRALYDWFVDWSSIRLAHKVLLDTHEHITYFEKTFHTKKEKFIRVFIGADEAVFAPREKQSHGQPFIIHFHGMFIPLQGIPYIINAAALLKSEPVIFRIIGTGQTYNLAMRQVNDLKLSNVKFVGRVPYTDLPKYIAESAICLGIFGDTDKTQRVIPNKVYEYMAMGKPIITADTPAIKEVFVDREDVLLCRPADGQAIAQAVKYLLENPQVAESIGTRARQKFESELRAKVIGQQLLKDLNVE